MKTPWGTADYIEALTPENDVIVVKTPSHGGIKVTGERLEKIPGRYRYYASQWSKGWGDEWFEEDVAALAVVVTFPDLFDHLDADDIPTLREAIDVACTQMDLRPLLEAAPHRYPNEVKVTFGSGIEYSLFDSGHFNYAWRSIDGTDLTEAEFIDAVYKIARAQ